MSSLFQDVLHGCKEIRTISSTTSNFIILLRRQIIFSGRESIMFFVLPNSIRSRLRPLGSIRATLSIPMDAGPFRSWFSSESKTPISEAETAIVRKPSTADVVDENGVEEAVPLPEQKATLTSEISIIVNLPAQPSGTDWKCARQGMRLLATAVEESMAASPSYSASFERRSYIDGVSYLMKALPADLDETEATILRRSLPPSLVDQIVPVEMTRPYTLQPAGGRSFLHRGTQMVVSTVIVWLCFVWPYILSLVRMMVHYERKYKFGENIVGQGIQLASTVGRKGMKLSGAVYNMSDGKVRQVLADALARTLHSIAGGAWEGVEQGWSTVWKKGD
ncbi:uncharacterized protein B0I36DRAFT_279255 [Microdochium trichocladiopsis]|uniref:Uncharacterized protein n=1 Tax=Microdochium trichocladiopsis TaxID=1682393 RepID=A0A9P9BI35_9PEZI|nr:uncharacterized protein B0I36DRAFT_279255 [Microdochium trichocladiopsis]KAH7010577.1 hypothetical protein B0I36DRAFT_279255 [Microdochium trichocladiopsis]